jgi:hypothetical protein
MAAAPAPTLGVSDSDSVEAVARGLLEAEERAAQPVKAAAPQPPVEEPEQTEEIAEPGEAEEPAADEPVEGEEGEPEAADGEQSALPAYAVPGEENPVPVDELISGYLRQKDYTQKTMLTANERKAVEQERRQFNIEREQVAARIGPLLQRVTAMLDSEDPRALEELRVTDPGAWSARMVSRQQQIESVQRLAAEQQALSQQAMAERIPQERAALAASEPAFAKDFAGSYRATGEYVLAQGFTPAEWNEVTDHRLVRMAHKAMRYDQLTTRKAPEVKKQLAALPKVARPGSPKPAGQVKAEKMRANRDAALKSGKVEDVARYLESAHPIN